jgi:hypothetical protein
MIRNTLGRWRLAAVELYNFPLELPVTLHICPEEERDKWIAEIDLDPAYKVNLQFFSQCRGSGSRIQCLFEPWMGKKSGFGIWIRNEQPGSYFRELKNNFVG